MGSHASRAFEQPSSPRGAGHQINVEHASDYAPSKASECSERLRRRPWRTARCDRIGETRGHCNDARPLKRMHTERGLERARRAAPSPTNIVQICCLALHALRVALQSRRTEAFRRRARSRSELHLVELACAFLHAAAVPFASLRTWSAAWAPSRELSCIGSRATPCPRDAPSSCFAVASLQHRSVAFPPAARNSPPSVSPSSPDRRSRADDAPALARAR